MNEVIKYLDEEIMIVNLAYMGIKNKTENDRFALDLLIKIRKNINDKFNSSK